MGASYTTCYDLQVALGLSQGEPSEQCQFSHSTFNEINPECSLVRARLKIPADCTTELNHNAYLFLQSVFHKHDKVSLG